MKIEIKDIIKMSYQFIAAAIVLYIIIYGNVSQLYVLFGIGIIILLLERGITRAK